MIDYNSIGEQITAQSLLVALGIFLGFLVLLKIFREIILDRLKKAAEKTKTDLDDLFIQVVKNIKPPFYFLISLYVALKYLTLPDFFCKVIDCLFILAIAIQIGRSLQAFINYGVKKVAQDKKAKSKSQIKIIAMVFKILLWTFVLLIILSNFGINITSLIAGLGIGGIAIAFALQNILTDIFSSFSIYFDKPFEEGDFIVLDQDKGIVKKIGIKTTRIQTLEGEELIISNKALTDARVRNFKKMRKRRIVFGFGIAYDISGEKLKKIPLIIKEIIQSIDLTKIDRVHFKEFGDFSLNFEVVYYVLVPDYGKYMDIQQKINLSLKEKLEKEGIEFAYPTYTIHMEKESQIASSQ